MVNAWNLTVPYQTASSLVLDRVSLSRAVGAIFYFFFLNLRWQKKKTWVTVQNSCIKKKGKKNAEPPLCSLNLIGLRGGAAESRNHFSIFSFVFLRYLPLTYDSALLGLQIVCLCLTQNQLRAARLVQSLVQGRRIHFILSVALDLFSCATVRQRLHQLFARCDLIHTQTRNASR